jgi:indoleamine 2,3-dioxygenase
MPILHTYRLESDVRQCRRAHLVLAFLVQQYVQSLPPRSDTDLTPIVIPASLAIPFVAVSRRLGIAAIVTYADVCLWNWALIDPSKPISGENLRILELFTGSPQEEHFFLTSTRIEIRSWEALGLMGKILKAQKATPSEQNIAAIASDLASLAIVMDDVARLFETVRDQCDPHWFYFTFRPVGLLSFVYSAPVDRADTHISFRT